MALTPPAVLRSMMDFAQLLMKVKSEQFNPASLCGVADWDLDADNLAEEQYRCIAHDIIRGAANPGIKPNLQDKEKIDRIVQ